ncbi:hypothetical protein Tco_1248017, partial [Tanacetum coccineum]
ADSDGGLIGVIGIGIGIERGLLKLEPN